MAKHTLTKEKAKDLERHVQVDLNEFVHSYERLQSTQSTNFRETLITYEDRHNRFEKEYRKKFFGRTSLRKIAFQNNVMKMPAQKAATIPLSKASSYSLLSKLKQLQKLGRLSRNKHLQSPTKPITDLQIYMSKKVMSADINNQLKQQVIRNQLEQPNLNNESAPSNPIYLQQNLTLSKQIISDQQIISRFNKLVLPSCQPEQSTQVQLQSLFIVGGNMKNDYIKQRKEELTHIARDMIDYQKSILELEGERYSSSMTGSRSLNPESHLESGKDVNWIISACRSYETKYHKAFSPKKKRMKAKQ